MRRAALLIGSPGNDLPGVKVDIENLSSFLKQPIGGAWFGNEITTLLNPSHLEVITALQSLKRADYSFVFFGGHGRHSVQKDMTELQLQPNVHIDASVLRVGAAKHTMIIDACRVLYAPTLRKSAMDAAFESMSMNFSESTARQVFDEHVSRCPGGLMELYSCDRNETAGETASDGGRYTSALTGVASAWKKRRDSAGRAVLSIKDAHDQAAEAVLALSGGRQHPKASYPRSQPYFPFAVRG